MRPTPFSYASTTWEIPRDHLTDHRLSETVAAPTDVLGGPVSALHPWRSCFSNVEMGCRLLYHVGRRRQTWNGTSSTGTRGRGCATLPPRGRRCCSAPTACSPTYCPACSRASRRRTWSAWLPKTSASPVKASCGSFRKTDQL